jgi:hypothetical protein
MKKETKSRSHYILLTLNIFLSCMFILSAAFFSVGGAKKAAAQMGEPFGGMSVFVWYCTCSFGIAIDIDDLTEGSSLAGPLVYTPLATTLYPFGMVFMPGAWMLGLYVPEAECMWYVGIGCSDWPVEGEMEMVGTSL